MNQTAIYPGTFDPVTYGHLDVIKRACALYDKVFVGVAHSIHKDPFFSVEERVEMIKDSVSGLNNVVIEDFNGLVVDYARERFANVVIRGIRMISDFEYEFQMALTNRKLDDQIETIFLMPNETYSYLSSRLIKEAAFLGADVAQFVPENVCRQLKRKLS